MSALEAFAYVRARSQSSDHERIRRQRCVMAALARQADPARLLSAFSRLARAARRNLSTDIPRRVLPELVRLVAGVDQRRVVSIGFVPPIRAATRKAIGPGGVRGASTLGGEVFV